MLIISHTQNSLQKAVTLAQMASNGTQILETRTVHPANRPKTINLSQSSIIKSYVIRNKHLNLKRVSVSVSCRRRYSVVIHTVTLSGIIIFFVL